MRSPITLLLGALALAVPAACSGTVVVDSDGGGGAGAGAAGTTSASVTNSTTTAGAPVSSVTVGSTSTGVTPCDEHRDCGPTLGTDVCVFSGGFCAKRCGPASPPCPPGSTCDECATGSCPGCEDCVGACL